MNNKIFLSILIPTFNRNTLIEVNFKFYYQILAKYKNIEIVIIDNNSKDTILVPTACHSLENFSFFRNHKNIGGVGNILKCLHLKASPWIWVVPDDCLPSIACLDKLLEILNNTRASIVIALNNKSNLHEVAVNELLTNEIALLEKLSWLPSTLYRSDLIKMYELQSKILSVHSYPHLVISCLYIINSVENINIPIISNAFSTLKYNDKRYSWIHGSLYKFSETILVLFGIEQGKKILKDYAKAMNLNELLIKHIIIEFPAIPLKTLLKIINIYGLGYINVIFIYLVIKIAPLNLLIIFFELLANISIISPVNRSKISKLRRNIIHSKRIDLEF